MISRGPRHTVSMALGLAVMVLAGCRFDYRPWPGPWCDLCKGGCTDLLTDRTNCGACGRDCGPGDLAFCDNGRCASWEHCPGFPEGTLTGCLMLDLPAGQSGVRCVNLDSDVANCGACYHACADGQSCCNGQCVTACGGCGNVCASGQTCCGGTCVYTESDNGNCSVCGNACPSGETCISGKCVPCVQFFGCNKDSDCCVRSHCAARECIAY